MLTFWDTRRGVMLADTLIKELPRLNRPARQQVFRLTSDEESSTVKEEIEKGAKVTGSYTDYDGVPVVVISRN